MSEYALVIGEALVDVVRRQDGSVEVHPGGSPANVALGLGRLGRPVELLTWLAEDDHGTSVREHLEASEVTLATGSFDAPATSVATALLDETGAASYEFDLTWHMPQSEIRPDAVVAHTGSIAAVLEPGGADVLALLGSLRDTATITYDPNARPSLMGDAAAAREKIEPFVAVADVVKMSDEDAGWLAPGESHADLARAWVALGPAAVVVTRGGDGATAYLADGRTVEVVAPRVTVADTVGAGDSFMGGLIDGLWTADLLGADRREALHASDDEIWRGVLERCTRIGAITVSRPGANPPSAAELLD